MNNLLYKYRNGNSTISIFSDGTKIRLFDGIVSPEFPESIDVKITNYCDANCSFCHEQSTISGSHADLNTLLKVLNPLPSGIELAIGGGNPLAHPQLIEFLTFLKNKGLISNITINQKHLKQYKDLILYLIKDELVKGIGISYTTSSYLSDIEPIINETNNVVFHTIIGINKIQDIDSLFNFSNSHNKTCKVLILGYKQFGFGINYYLKNSKIEDNKYQWYIKLPLLFKKKGLVLSFDNLAIQQLNLKRLFTDASWDKFYMGDDGQYTCYIDAVNQEFATSSTSRNRVSFNNTSLIEFFKSIH